MDDMLDIFAELFKANEETDAFAKLHGQCANQRKNIENGGNDKEDCVKPIDESLETIYEVEFLARQMDLHEVLTCHAHDMHRLSKIDIINLEIEICKKSRAFYTSYKVMEQNCSGTKERKERDKKITKDTLGFAAELCKCLRGMVLEKQILDFNPEELFKTLFNRP